MKTQYVVIGVLIMIFVVAIIYKPIITNLSVFTMSPATYCALSGWTLKSYYCSGYNLYVTCVDSNGGNHYATLTYHQLCGATPCGDGNCGTGEDYLNCPADCSPPVSVPFCSTTDCNDGDVCTQDTCNEQLRRCLNIFVYSGLTAYDDSNKCTTDYCFNNQINHDIINCVDGNKCTVDSCNPTYGCVYTPILCQSGYECNTISGQCEYIEPCAGVVCSNYCTGYTLSHSGVCLGGVCTYDTEANSVTCGYDACLGLNVNDGNSCTVDYCIGGEILHDSVICPPDTDCNIGTGMCEGVGFEPIEPQDPIILALIPFWLIIPIGLIILIASIMVIGRVKGKW